MVAADTARRTSSIDRPSPASCAGFACSLTARVWPPSTVTAPTPDTWLSFCTIAVCARSLTSCSGSVSEVSARISTGVSAGFTSW